MNNNKSKDIELLLKGVDISPSMYKDAESKYKVLANFFKENGLECDIYPQGSFALGTVVRPLKDGKKSDYDLDFICLVTSKNESLTPRELKDKIGNLLKDNGVYSEKLKEWEKCWTLSYAETNGIGFNIDIIPAMPDYNNFIKITDINLETNIGKWIISNPKDYIEWYDNINSKFPEVEKNKKVFESIQNNVEDLPDMFERTSLQRVIQILKVHRDSYYFKARKENKKVISAIITTLCTKIVESSNYNTLDIESLLEKIVQELKVYKDFLFDTEENFMQKYPYKNIIRKKSGKWEILNPVNPNDNLADQWNEDNEKATLFFKWIDNVYEDIIENNDEKYVYALESVFNNFGSDYVSKRIDLSKFKNSLENRKEVNTEKPWKK